MATIRKRGTKFQVQVRRVGFPALSRSFTRKADAQEWARHVEAQADRGELPTNAKALRRITVRSLLERYRDTVVPQKRGFQVETYILNALLRQPFASLTLAEAVPQVFADYRDKRLRTVRPVTICRELNILQHAFGIAQREWGFPLTQNPIKQITKPTSTSRRQRRLLAGELQSLLGACKDSRNGHLRPLILLAIETGMRRGEILSLRWNDINWADHTLYIPQTKNGEPRTIPLSPKAQEILTALHNGPGERVFPISGESAKQAWQRLTARAGIRDLHFHDLRHEAISRFFEMGLSLPEVALISGHKDPRMLFRYTHLSAGKVADKMAQMLGAPEI